MHYLAGNRAALPGAIWMMIVSAGFGEETVFRGFLFERLGKLLGSSRRAKAAIVVFYIRVVRNRALREPVTTGCAASHDLRARVREHLRDHGPHLDVDDRARRVRLDRAGADLLEPGNEGRPLRIQLNRTPMSSPSSVIARRVTLPVQRFHAAPGSLVDGNGDVHS